MTLHACRLIRRELETAAQAPTQRLSIRGPVTGVLFVVREHISQATQISPPDDVGSSVTAPGRPAMSDGRDVGVCASVLAFEQIRKKWTRLQYRLDRISAASSALIASRQNLRASGFAV